MAPIAPAADTGVASACLLLSASASAAAAVAAEQLAGMSTLEQLDPACCIGGGGGAPKASGKRSKKAKAKAKRASDADSIAADPAAAALVLEQDQLAELTSLMCRRVTFVDRQGARAFDTTSWDLVTSLRSALAAAGIGIDSLKLEGSAASHCLNQESVPEYSDLDFVFHLSPSTTRAQLEQIRDVLAKQLASHMPHAASYSGDHVLFSLIHKQFISPATDADAWAVYALGGSRPGTSVDLKFVQRLARPFQFSVDSFAIVLDDDVVGQHFSRQLLSASTADKARTTSTSSTSSEEALTDDAGDSDAGDSEDSGIDSSDAPPPAAGEPHPTVRFETAFEPASVALQHLADKQIAVASESDLCQVRGGGMLKYARFLSRGWTVAATNEKGLLQRYMVTRFMCDFPLYMMTRYGTFAPAQHMLEFVEERYSPPDGVPLAMFFSRLEQIVVESNVPGCEDLRRATQYVASAYGLCLVQRARLPQVGAGGGPAASAAATARSSSSTGRKRSARQKQPQPQRDDPSLAPPASSMASNHHSRSCPDLFAKAAAAAAAGPGKGTKHSRPRSPSPGAVAPKSPKVVRAKSPTTTLLTATSKPKAGRAPRPRSPKSGRSKPADAKADKASSADALKATDGDKGAAGNKPPRANPIIVEGDENIPSNQMNQAQQQRRGSASAPTSPARKIKRDGNVWQNRMQTQKLQKQTQKRPSSPKLAPSPTLGSPSKKRASGSDTPASPTTWPTLIATR